MSNKPEVIARRRTYDDKLILLWSDGDITQGYVGALVSRRVPMDAAWLVMGEICLYDLAEAKRLVQVARQAVKQRQVRALTCLRRKMAGLRRQNVSRDWGCYEWKPLHPKGD